MNRPRYETEYDIKNERTVREILKEYHDNCSLEKPKNAHYSQIDFFAFHQSKCIGLFEIKCRNFFWGKHSTVMLSSGKWAEGFKYSQALSVPFYFIVSAYDGTFQYKQDINDVISGKIICEWKGRTDAIRDSGDLEPTMMIPNELFVKISEENAWTNKPSE